MPGGAALCQSKSTEALRPLSVVRQEGGGNSTGNPGEMWGGRPNFALVAARDVGGGGEIWHLLPRSRILTPRCRGHHLTPMFVQIRGMLRPIPVKFGMTPSEPTFLPPDRPSSECPWSCPPPTYPTSQVPCRHSGTAHRTNLWLATTALATLRCVAVRVPEKLPLQGTTIASMQSENVPAEDHG